MNHKKSTANGNKRPFGKKRNSGGFNKLNPKNNRRKNFRGGGGGRKRKRPDFPVDKLIHKGVPLVESVYESDRTYRDFDLHPSLQKNLDQLGYKKPTEVQDRTFETVADLQNVMAIANTGTGKTAAFLIPLLNALMTEDTLFSTLIMVPTRELALQVEEEFRKLSKGMKLYATCVIGGQKISKDISRLSRPNHFVIGTPGRLVDLSMRRVLNFADFSVLVLDEFDRMLDMGFSKDVDFITSKMQQRDQTLLFSATLDKSQKEIIEKLMPEKVEFKITDGKTTAEHIDQDVVYASRDSKKEVLMDMLHRDDFEKVLVFAETKRNVGKLTQTLRKSKIKADEIHGDKSQNYRKNALRAFRSGKVNVLVATDVAARGLDIKGVTHVINYEMPQDYETYIHRIGRTGRAGKTGKAFTFVEKKRERKEAIR